MRINNLKDRMFPIMLNNFIRNYNKMAFFSQRLLKALKRKVLLFVISESSKLDAMRSSLSITFAVTMATFFVCDEWGIEKCKEKSIHF